MKRPHFAIACALAAALVVGVYANSLGNAFHFDDSHVVVSNIYIRSLANVERFFTDANTFSSLPQNATYRPLVTLSLAVDYALGHGLDPRVFHRTQIVLLLLTGALLTAFFVDLTRSRWLALFAATLFCVHTANTETMNLISARSELLSTIALLLSFLLFIRVPFARRTFLYLVPLAVGALAKAPLVVFAPLLFVYLLLYEKKSRRDALRETLPSLILGIALLVFLNAMNSPEWTSGGGSRFHYLITQPFVWLHYFRLFFLPMGLTGDTDWKPFAEWYDTRAIAGYAFVALLAWWIARAWRREGDQTIAFGLAWFAIALIPTSSIFPLAEVANEHRIFFAWIGLVIAVTSWVFTRSSAAVPKKVLVAAAVLVLLANAIGAHERNEVWRTEESLWSDVVRKSPGNGRAWMNYGLTRMSKGDYAGAKASFNRSAAMLPDYSFVQINLGIAEGATGNHAKAEGHFRRALELSPDANANFYYGRWLVTRGRAPEALPLLREALRLSPALPESRGLLLRLYEAIGANEFEPLALETARIDAGDPSLALVRQRFSDYESGLNAGLVAMQKQDWLTAAHATREALRHDPRSADGYNNLGWTLAQLGFRAEALAAYERALAIDPSHERARNNRKLVR